MEPNSSITVMYLVVTHITSQEVNQFGHFLFINLITIQVFITQFITLDVLILLIGLIVMNFLMRKIMMVTELFIILINMIMGWIMKRTA